jgi:hypothetical protein
MDQPESDARAIQTAEALTSVPEEVRDAWANYLQETRPAPARATRLGTEEPSARQP